MNNSILSIKTNTNDKYDGYTTPVTEEDIIQNKIMENFLLITINNEEDFKKFLTFEKKCIPNKYKYSFEVPENSEIEKFLQNILNSTLPLTSTIYTQLQNENKQIFFTTQNKDVKKSLSKNVINLQNINNKHWCFPNIK